MSRGLLFLWLFFNFILAHQEGHGQGHGTHGHECTSAHSHSHSHPEGRGAHSQQGHGQGHGHEHKSDHSHSHPHSHADTPAHWNDLPIKLINEYASHFGFDPKLFGAVVSTIVVGVVPIFFLYLLPITKKVNGATVVNQALMKILLAFAAGGLLGLSPYLSPLIRLGDAFLHLIPHALNPHDHQDSHTHTHDHDHHGHDHSHNHSQQTLLGVYILGGIFVFFLVEKIITLLGGHSHNHAHQPAPTQQQSKQSNQRVKTSALLNVIADFIHNFTDGMAIAASYSAGLPLGITTTIAVFIHEIPHEIGDMAILITSGVTFQKVVLIQLATALGALLGTFFGFFVTASLSDAILPMTAGGFIYIAMVSVLPQLFEDTNTLQTLLESAAMIGGGAIMYLIATFE